MADRTIRILHVLASAQRGGTEIMTVRLIAHMSSRFDNEVCLLDRSGPISEQLEDQGVVVHHLPPGRFMLPIVALRLFCLLRAGSYDIVQLYGLWANVVGRVVGRLAGCQRILGALRSQRPTALSHEWPLRVDRLTFRLCLGYVSNSQAAVDYLVAHRYDPSRFWVIRNGIDLSPFARISDKDRGRIRARFEVTPDLPIIVCVGNLRSVKGHADLLRALGELARTGTRFSAVLVGKGPLRQELERLAGALNIESQVHFEGEMSEAGVAEILHVTDVFALASLREGTPTAVIEAMAAGCPVVATRVGGTPELVIDGVTGILVDPSNPKALASALRQLLTDRTLCRRMGAAGRERAAACFSIERMVHEYEDLYTSFAGPP